MYFTTCGVADEMYVLSASNKRVSVELVGKDKIQDKLSRFEELTGASLSFLGVSSPGSSPCDIGTVLPSKLGLGFVLCLDGFVFVSEA